MNRDAWLALLPTGRTLASLSQILPKLVGKVGLTPLIRARMLHKIHPISLVQRPLCIRCLVVTSARAEHLQTDGGRSTSPGLPLIHSVFFLLFFPFGLHVYSGVTSAVILRNPAMEKSNLILKHLHFLKSNGRYNFSFS